MSSSPEIDFSAQELTTIRSKLSRWFRQAGRELPWRTTNDPYHIWLSEIMLQQTTVKAVIPYYIRFLNRFPTVEDLAAATEADVLKYWEGLGYYSRGRNLRKAAIAICNDHHGELPQELAILQKLPGIGRYTAGAIRSFAFNLPAPILEANTLRLYARLLNFSGDPKSRDGEKILWEFAELLQRQKNPGVVNQALMELGSQICTPVDPSCDRCPLMIQCRAWRNQTQHQIPLKKSRPKITKLVETTVAIKSGNEFLIRQRQPEERWCGMWDFIRFETTSIGFQQKLTPTFPQSLNKEVRDHLSDQLSLKTGEPLPVTEIRHSVTRYRIRLLCLLMELPEKPKLSPTGANHFRWVDLKTLEGLPMPITGREFSEKLKNFKFPS